MSEQRQLDESDEALVRQLKVALSQGRYEVGTEQGQDGGEPSGGGGGRFLEAMNAYRAARAGGDREEIARAERALQEATRADLEEFERGQGRPGIPRRDIHDRM